MARYLDKQGLKQVYGVIKDQVTLVNSKIKDGKLTITLSGSNKGTFTANLSTNTTINIDAYTRAELSQSVKTYSLNLTSLSKDNFYPVTFDESKATLNCEIHSPSRSATLSPNLNAIHYELQANGGSDTPTQLNIISYNCFDNSEITIGCIGRGTATGVTCIWLRGGDVYEVYSNHLPTLRTSNYTAGTSTTDLVTFSVGTTYSGGTANNNVDILFTPQTTITQGGYTSKPFKSTEFIGKLTGNAATATKLQTARTIQLTGDVTGSASFDGSSNASIVATVADNSHNHTISNITDLLTTLNNKSNVGHTHTKSNITDFPTSLKNPNNLTVLLNGGTTEGTNKFTYDGSTAKSINITPSTIGAATTSSTVSKAKQLETARTLTVNLGTTVSESFNGSANASLGVSGTLPVSNGGTGVTTLTTNAVVTGNGSGAVKTVATANGALYATAANGAAKFGTLPVALGGTGITSNPSMVVNLSTTITDSVLKASPRPGVTGVLSAANGGTGNSSLNASANALLNSLTTASAVPADGDYYISLYVNGGTTYHRRPISALYSYLANKMYSKSEVDAKINSAISSTYKYVGSVESVDKLPTNLNNTTDVGKVYNITVKSSYGEAGQNVAWTGTGWDTLGSTIDLSTASVLQATNLKDTPVISDSGTNAFTVKAGNKTSNAYTPRYASNADKLDNYHEYSFLRYRGKAAADAEDTLWSLIGIKEYEKMLPKGLSNTYNYGAAISLPSGNGRFDLWYSHLTSSAGLGLRYRTGWVTDAKEWRVLIDDSNIKNYTAGGVDWSNISNKPDLDTDYYKSSRGTLAATTDFNTITKPGSYKVLMTAWGTATTYHSPNSLSANIYSFGILYVFTSTNDTEARLSLLYMPHSSTSNYWCFRFRNSGTWSSWQWLSTDSHTTLDGHYTPTANTNSALNASSTTAATWNSTSMVTGILRDAKGHVTGITSIKMPANPNTDTKVTSVGNHYVPTENTASQINASSTTAATWDSTSLVTGIKRDAAGHVVGVTSVKMPANPNTTYSAGEGLTLSGTTFSSGENWNAVTLGLKWSRICYAKTATNAIGCGGILAIGATRSNTVINYTFIITATHLSKGYITQLSGTYYSTVKVRLDVDSNGNFYVDLYDDTASIASGATLFWKCTWIPTLPSTLTKYTAYTDGSTIPSGFTALPVLTTDKTGGSIVASNLIGKVNGYTINASVPTDAKFTDTWRPVENVLTSTSTTNSLSAAQGKVLNDKFANYSLTSHNHNGVYAYINSANGIKSYFGEGTYSYVLVATIKISSSYVNSPITFEVSGRAIPTTWLQVQFVSASSTDPALSYITSDNYSEFWIYKSATSTWQVYAKLSEVYGSLVIHRILGAGANIGVTVNMTGASSVPSGATKASYGGNAAYATKADSATKWNNQLSLNWTGTISSTNLILATDPSDSNTVRGISPNSLLVGKAKADGDGNVISSAYLKLNGSNTMTGPVKSTYASSTYVNSFTNSIINANYSGFGSIFNAPTKSGKITLATYPNTNDEVYLAYASKEDIAAGTNTYAAANRIVWTPLNNTLKATIFDGMATKLRDSNNGTAITASYSKDDITATKLAVWNGYELRKMDTKSLVAGSASKLVTSETSANSNYTILLVNSGTGYYANGFTYNPATKTLTASNLNGVASKSRELTPTFTINSNEKNNFKYHRIASTSGTTLRDTDAIILINLAYNGGKYGILKISLRSNPAATNAETLASATWLVRYGLDDDSVVIAKHGTSEDYYADVFFITPGAYARTVATVLYNINWKFYSSAEVSGTTETDRKTSVECYSSLADACTVLHTGTSYDGNPITISTLGVVRTAINDASGNNITATYLNRLTGGTTLPEASSTITDNTELITSYASNNGFNDPNGTGRLYRRDAICIWNYIKGKTDSLYLKLTGGTVSDTINLSKVGGSWSIGMSKAAINYTPIGVRDGSRYDPILMGKDTEGNVWNLGWSSLGVGFYGFLAGRTANGVDSYLVYDPKTGITSGTFKGSVTGNLSGTATKANTGAWTAKTDNRNYQVGYTLDSAFNYDSSNSFQYNPSTKTLKVTNITGTASKAKELTPYLTINTNNTNYYKYHRIASIKGSNSYLDSNALLLIDLAYVTGGTGLLKLTFRSNNATTKLDTLMSATWLFRLGLSNSSIVMAKYGTSEDYYADVFFITPGAYARTKVLVLYNLTWTLYTSTEATDSTTTDRKTSVECYSSLTDAATQLHNGTAYTSNMESSLAGGISHASAADTANTASTAGGLTARASYTASNKLSSASYMIGTGLSWSTVYNAEGPDYFGNLLELGNSGKGQLFMSWSGVLAAASDNNVGKLYYRSKRDQIAGFSAWKQIPYTSGNGTATHIDSWSAGSAPTLGAAISADDITAWSAGSVTTASYSNGMVTITNGSAPSLSYTARSIPNVTSVGSVPTLTKTDISVVKP